MARLQAGAAAGPAVLAQTFGPLSTVGGAAAAGAEPGEAGCLVYFDHPEDPQGLQVAAANAAFARLFGGLEGLHSAFVVKRTVHILLGAL
jgi:hypothetical protein